mmetsp:Transcript_61128/g.147180  ORF Transcript_61128/g.147180 Transcript_61128/m.147180 type:complete len:366 (-) Transcript_61128:768-1865(-)
MRCRVAMDTTSPMCLQATAARRSCGCRQLSAPPIMPSSRGRLRSGSRASRWRSYGGTGARSLRPPPRSWRTRCGHCTRRCGRSAAAWSYSTLRTRAKRALRRPWRRVRYSWESSMSSSMRARPRERLQLGWWQLLSAAAPVTPAARLTRRAMPSRSPCQLSRRWSMTRSSLTTLPCPAFQVPRSMAARPATRVATARFARARCFGGRTSSRRQLRFPPRYLAPHRRSFRHRWHRPPSCTRASACPRTQSGGGSPPWTAGSPSRRSRSRRQARCTWPSLPVVARCVTAGAATARATWASAPALAASWATSLARRCRARRTSRRFCGGGCSRRGRPRLLACDAATCCGATSAGCAGASSHRFVRASR